VRAGTSEAFRTDHLRRFARCRAFSAIEERSWWIAAMPIHEPGRRSVAMAQGDDLRRRLRGPAQSLTHPAGNVFFLSLSVFVRPFGVGRVCQ